jgi:hypothetical protein
VAENFNDDQVAPVALLLWDGTKWTRFTTTTTIPVSLASLPLPTDAATETTLAALLVELGQKLEDGGNVTVTGSVTANAGTNLNTSALATAANQLPDSHNVTVDNAAGASAVNIQDGGNAITVDWAGTAPPIGGGTEATALKVTIASDSTGILSVDDNGGSLTVDGTSVNPATSFGKTITYVSVAQGAAGTTALASASVGNKHKLVGACLVGDAAGTVSFTDGTVTLCGAMSIAANAGFVLPTSILPYTETAATNRPLNLVTVTAKVSGMVAILTEA